MSNISGKPNPVYRILLSKRKKRNNFFQKFIFFQNGRDAMLFGLEKLKLDKAESLSTCREKMFVR